ncbi:MAG: hypothetical protein K2J20_05010, partial [Bacilli bacterium]|nr:hypothetical protein [Bacilli bacterium]
MVLNGNSLKKYLSKNQLVENGIIENIHSSSYDVTSDNFVLKFTTFTHSINLCDANTLDQMYQKTDIENGYLLKPQECILVPLIDNFNIPDNICAHIRGRTSFNRLGLSISLQHLNPGYKGKLNIAITNNSPNTYELLPNMRIAQIVFETMDNKVSEDLLYYNESTPVYYNE